MAEPPQEPPLVVDPATLSVTGPGGASGSIATVTCADPPGQKKLPVAGPGVTFADSLETVQLTEEPQSGEQVAGSSSETLPPGQPVPDVSPTVHVSKTQPPEMHDPPVHGAQSGLFG